MNAEQYLKPGAIVPVTNQAIKDLVDLAKQQADRIAELERIELNLREQIKETETRSKYYGWAITGLR